MALPSMGDRVEAGGRCTMKGFHRHRVALEEA